MWRFIVLALVAFVCGLLQTALQLGPRETWQIPAAVGLAVYLASLSIKPKKTRRAEAVTPVRESVASGVPAARETSVLMNR